MERKNQTVSPGADREIRMSREFKAPVELMWKVWTDASHLKNWWGPNGFTNTISRMDMTPGGEWNLVMHGPDGTDYKNKSLFREVIEHKKIVYEHVSGPKFIATIEFESRGSKTFLTWHMLFETREEFVQTVKTFKADEGLRQNLEKLGEYLDEQQSTADRKLITSRVINAPRELVFAAWTKPEHLIHWWGPNGFTNTFQETDIRPGGKWKFIMHGPDGKDYPNEVLFHEITPPTKLRYSHSGPGHPEWLNFSTTVTFEEVGPGKTLCTMTGLFQSKEAVEHVIREHGAKKGGEETIGKLAAYVESLQK